MTANCNIRIMFVMQTAVMCNVDSMRVIVAHFADISRCVPTHFSGYSHLLFFSQISMKCACVCEENSCEIAEN